MPRVGRAVEILLGIATGTAYGSVDDEPPAPSPVLVRSQIVRGGAVGGLQRADWLTPYVIETIGRDALDAGPGARLEITLAGVADSRTLAVVRAAFEWVRARGVSVQVHRDHRRPPRTTEKAA